MKRVLAVKWFYENRTYKPEDRTALLGFVVLFVEINFLCEINAGVISNNWLFIPLKPSGTAQWSLYVPHSGHYMYRTVVTICTSQWSLNVPPV